VNSNNVFPLKCLKIVRKYKHVIFLDPNSIPSADGVWWETLSRTIDTVAVTYLLYRS